MNPSRQEAIISLWTSGFVQAGARQKRDETGLGVGWLSGTVLA